MKTIIIDLDALTPHLFKEIVGFVLRTGLNFRKIDFVTQGKTSQSLVVELATKGEEKALNAFLKAQGIATPITVKNDNKAVLGRNKLGTFCQVQNVDGLASYWLDRTSGKKFALIQGEL